MTSLRPARAHHSRQRSHRSRRPANRPSSAPAAVSALDAALVAAQQRPAPTTTTFAELGLPDSVVAVLTRAGIERPTAIQALTMPDALAGRDVLGRAQTGSGKTLGFGLPMLTRLRDGKQRSGAPRGLVLAPTRELAQQVAAALRPAAGAVRQYVGVAVGGVSIGKQITELRRGVDVLVATPGRLLDLMERGAVRLDAVEVAVLDEADHMADLGFLPDVTRILEATPDGRQCLLFSATLDRGVGKLVERFLSDPAVHVVGETATPAADMEHRTFVLEHAHKVQVAAEIGLRPARTLFFVRTKHGADRLARQLGERGVGAVAVHGDLNQNQRNRAVAAFTSGRSRVLVATDVAARGLHVDDLDLVVHFDPPNDVKDYLHRSGRTARAGASGTVITFTLPAQTREVEQLHRGAGATSTSTRVRPGHEAVREVAASGEPVVVAPEPERRERTGRQPRRPRRDRGPRGARRR